MNIKTINIKLLIFSLMMAPFILVGCQQNSEKSHLESVQEKIQKNKKIVQNFFDGVNGISDISLALASVNEDYIQHNAVVSDGGQSILDWAPILQANNFKFTTHRFIADETYVVAHSEGKNSPVPGLEQLVTFDVYRIENGKLAEHWDNVMPMATKPNPSGRSQVDGETHIKDHHKTDQNKTLVTKFVETTLIAGNTKNIADFVSSDEFKQHNIYLEDGINTLKNALMSPDIDQTLGSYEKLHFVVAEGNFVFTAVEGKHTGKPVGLFSLFRVENDKIVEMWDTAEVIPDHFPHNNGKF